MRVLKLRSITLRNWCRTRESRVDFPPSGYVHVRGHNQTAPGQVDSSGAGKTALGEALNRTLLGASLSAPLSDYSCDGGGDTYVKVEATLRDRPLVVELGYKCAEFPDCDGEGLRFAYDGQTTERPHSRETRRELSRLVGVSPEVSMWTIFIDGDRLKFNRLPQAEALGLLMQALNQPPWDEFKAKAERRREARQAEADRAAERLVHARLRAESSEEGAKAAARSLDDADLAYAASERAWEAECERHRASVVLAAGEVQQAALARDALRTQIREAQAADAAEFGKLELELTRLLGEQRTTQAYLSGWKEEVAAAQSNLAHAETELASMTSGKDCPTCGKAMSGPADEATLARARSKVSSHAKKLGENSTGRDECQKCLNEVEKDLADLRQRRTALRSSRVGPLSRELEAAEETLARADRKLRDVDRAAPLKPSDAALRRAEAIAGERLAQAESAQAELATAAAALAEAEKRLSVAAYWVRGFSPSGIPNLVLRQTIGPLNEAARIISDSLSGGVVRVRFSAEAELAKGGAVPKLVTEVETAHGASKLSRNSKGEVGRANLIIAETQTHVGRVLQRVGYRWFDEAVNSQDPVVRRNIYASLRRQAHERGILTFVVDHHEEAAAVADRTLVADKSADGWTTYRWE